MQKTIETHPDFNLQISFRILFLFYNANRQKVLNKIWKLLEGVGKLGGGAPIAFVFVMLTPRLSWKINKPVDGHWRLSAEWVCILIKPVFRWLLSDADRTCTPTHPPSHYQVLKIKLDNANGEEKHLKKLKSICDARCRVPNIYLVTEF